MKTPSIKPGVHLLVLIPITVLNCAGEEEPRNSHFTPTALCGNNRVEAGEVCDGSDLKEATCESLGFDSGTLACSSACGLDTTGCEGTCPPDCQGRECGPDPVCSTSCGTCTTGACNSLGQCEGNCTPDCQGRECGLDPVCSTSCGTCAEGECNALGQCVSNCTPDCQGRECGLDPVCSTRCGTCAEGECDALGQCVVEGPEAPTILTFNTNVNSISSGDSITFTAVVTDPDGIDDVIGGTLVDPVTTNAYGAFATSAAEGSYSLTIDWADINQVRAIDFTSSENRTFVAQFHDQTGNMTTTSRAISLTCDGEPACDGSCGLSRCGQECVDLRQDEYHCGSCTNSCMDGGVCANGGCECAGRTEVDCPGVGCTDLKEDEDNCGICGKSCPSDNCGSGRCTCGSTVSCPGSETCSKYEYSDTYRWRCFGVGDGYLDGSRSASSGEVQLTIDGNILPVCSWFNPRNVPEVICRELHGASSTVVSVNSDFEIDVGLGVYPVCTGTEMRLADCELSFESYCPFNEGYYVECGTACTPNCSGRECGDNGCGGSCGICPDGGECSLEGTCPGGMPPGWSCHPSYYDATDGCDCECGAYDPDCSLNDQALLNCGADATGCDSAGHCIGG